MDSQAQQQQQQGSPYGIPTHNLGSNIVYLTNPGQELFELELTYRGEKLLSNGKTLAVGEPQMNELGIARVMGQIKSVVGQVTILGNVNEAHLQNIYLSFCDTMIQDLMINMKMYGIKSSVGRNVVFTEAKFKVWTCLLRAFNEGDRKFWSKITYENKNVNTENSNQGGALSKAIGWVKG